jgi:DNA-binding SARP family transcriptional activator/tetratricopeptide (TPR) repeat protein
LLAVLAGRWDRRATIIVGGAGFGKSTLLGQALSENLLAPHGRDAWLSCTAADTNSRVFFDAVGDALGLDLADAAEATADTLAAAIATLAPGLCLVLDDVHEISPGSDGHELLSALIRVLPLQCSLVLCGRSMPTLPIADWTAKGLTTFITEEQLTYSSSEVDVLATLASIEPSALVRYGGWPALMELALVSGHDGSEAYLRQLLLGSVPARQQRWIIALDAIDGGDLALVQAALGEPADPTLADDFASLAEFPAVEAIAGGGFRMHQLWHDTLASLAAPDERLAMQRRAAVALLDIGDHDGAIRLFDRADDSEGVCGAILDSCRTGTWRYPTHVLERWRHSLPPSFAETPEALMLDGLVGREGATFSRHTVQRLVDAAGAFRARGDVGAEVATLAEIAFVAREQGHDEAFAAVPLRLVELLFEGRSEVGSFIALSQATAAEESDDDIAALIALDSLDPALLSRQWWSRALWLRAHSLVLLGRPSEAIEIAARAVETAEDDFLGGRYLLAYARWWTGADPAVIGTLPFIADEAYRTPFDSVYGGAVFAALHAFAGDVERARTSWDIAAGELSNHGSDGLARAEYVGLLRIAEVALLVAVGDEETARSSASSWFEASPIAHPTGRRVAKRHPGLVYVLVESQRQALDAVDLGPTLSVARQVGAWLVDARAGRLQPFGYSPAELLCALPLRLAVETCAHLATTDIDAARILAEQVAAVHRQRVRPLLRELAESVSDERVADGARKLLMSVPIEPTAPVVIKLFGPMRVVHDDTESRADGGELRRERVRQLITALAVFGPTTREQLCAMMWPELERDAGLRNLRTTLNYVHRVLEPDRRAGDATFVIRQRGAHLSMVGLPWVETDIAVFHRHLAEADAAAAGGAHSSELVALDLALQQVLGQPLAEVTFEEWAQPTIRATTSAVVAAARRAAAMWFARSDHAQAQRAAGLALTYDPWSDAAHQIMVASHMAFGQLKLALDHFRQWERLRAEIGLGLSDDMEMLGRRLGVSPAV